MEYYSPHLAFFCFGEGGKDTYDDNTMGALNTGVGLEFKNIWQGWIFFLTKDRGALFSDTKWGGGDKFSALRVSCFYMRKDILNAGGV